MLKAIFLFASAAVLMRADVSITSGTISSQYISGANGGETGGIQIMGPNLSLVGASGGPAAGLAGGINVNFGAQTDGQTATFTLLGSATISAASLILAYDGDPATNGLIFDQGITLTMNFVGLPVTVATTQNADGSYTATASNKSFSMSGTVALYSNDGSIITSVPISGYGLFSAFLAGNAASDSGGLLATTSYVFCSPTPGSACQAPPPASVVFGLDTTTQGAWSGKYGGDGYVIANEASSFPAYAAVSVTGDVPYTWAGQTSDARALQAGPGSTVGIASAYTQDPAGNLVININFTDGNSHRVGLYLLDWDSTSRAQTITITDADSNLVLDTKTFSSFSNGEYAVWNLQGSVIIAITPTGTGAAVVSGIFFGPGGSASPPPPGLSSNATYAGLDTTTVGAWSRKYGANGYMIANGPSSAPSYAAASIAGDFTYTWASQTSDARALQTFPGSPTGVAASYTADSGASFSINVNITDGQTHPIALYLLDWDSTSRIQTISIMDAATNTVLDNRTFSGFHNGQYALWNIKGNVIITVNPAGPQSAVISGVFFN
jgi:hypothetical protein